MWSPAISIAIMYIIKASHVQCLVQNSVLSVPGNPERFTCGNLMTLICTIDPLPTIAMTWTMNASDISTCFGSICSSNTLTPTHYSFTFDGSSYTLTINTVKIADNGTNITCRDTTMSNPIQIEVEVVPDSSTTTIVGIYSGEYINFTTKACVSSVNNVKVIWKKKSVANNQTSIIEEDDDIDTTTVVTMCQLNTDCSTNGISSDIQVLADNTAGSEYHICIEIYRTNGFIFQNCTRTSYKLKDSTTEISPTTCWCEEHVAVCVMIILVAVCIGIIIVIIIVHCLCLPGAPTDLTLDQDGELTWKENTGCLHTCSKGLETRFCIEKIHPSVEEWTPCNTDPVTVTKFRVTDDSKTTFRVKAANKFGVSNPSKTVSYRRSNDDRTKGKKKSSLPPITTQSKEHAQGKPLANNHAVFEMT